MATFTMIEKQNFNSMRDGDQFEAKTLTAAKIKASKAQCFQGTVIELLDSTVATVAMKDETGKWLEMSCF